jgi:hypothetical protein
MPPTRQAKPPTNEIGLQQQGSFSYNFGSLTAWSAFVDTAEYVPDLVWPNSVLIYDQMRSDPQLDALLAGSTLPIRRYHWLIDPNGADAAIVDALSSDLNLDIKGQEPRPRQRQRDRFSFHSHLKDALLGLAYGHAFFEQVLEYKEADGLYHLRKLAPRPQRTISNINVAEDGGLVSIQQNIVRQVGGNLVGQFPEIPVDRLLAYVWDQEGSSWVGRSMMRSCYKPWLIKDRLLRIDAINHERAGGVPWIESAPGSTPTEISDNAQLAQDFRVGEHGGGALPAGAKLNLARIGAGSDVISSIRYHDETMARRFLLMLLQLGQTHTGSRSLGGEFAEFFKLAQESIADWFVDTFNAFMIEDYVDWNFGEDVDKVPQIVYERSEGNVELAVADLVALIDSGAIVVDIDLEEHLRSKYLLSDKTDGARKPGEPDPAAVPPTPAPVKPPTVAAASAALLSLPDRQLRRQPYAHEITASTDFAALELAWQSEVGALVAEYTQIQARQADQLAQQVAAANGNLKKLAALQATPAGADLILSRMLNMVANGINEAVKEATNQGVTSVIHPDTAKLEAQLAARAEAIAEMLASSYSDSARRKAVSVSELPSTEAGTEVRLHLRSLSDAYLHDQMGGTLVSAQNYGRKLAINANSPSRVYASELLDTNTCVNCVARDGTEYVDVAQAELDYPTGGYKDCLGGPRCRGTLVAVYE